MALAQEGSSPRRSWSRYTDDQLRSLRGVRREDANPWVLVTVPVERIGFISLQTARTIAFVAVAGIVPLAVAVFGRNDLWSYWALALYASALWGIVFMVAYHPQGAQPPIAAGLFLTTAVGSTGALLVALHFGLQALRAPLLGSTHPSTSFFGYVFFVGLVEEMVKLLPVVVFAWLSAKRFPALRLFIFYGLMSGLGFGIYEGVAYQMGDNLDAALGADSADTLTTYYIANVVRLTSAPFLHAVWTGLAALFVWFGFRFKGQRTVAIALAITIPSLLHGLYDQLSVANAAVSIAVPVASVIILGLYIGSADAIERAIELRDEARARRSAAR